MTIFCFYHHKLMFLRKKEFWNVSMLKMFQIVEVCACVQTIHPIVQEVRGKDVAEVHVGEFEHSNQSRSGNQEK